MVDKKRKLARALLFVLVCCVVTSFAMGRGSDQEADEGFGRELTEYKHQSWYGLQPKQPEDSSGWIPRYPGMNQSGVVTTKRRRLRKRKRRPPVVSYAGDSSVEIAKPTKKFFEEKENTKREEIVSSELEISLMNDRFGQEEDFVQAKRRRRPNVREPLDEMEEESARPYIRRRVTPAYDTSEEADVITSSKVRPLGASISFGTQVNPNDDADQYRENDDTYPYFGGSKTTKKKQQYTTPHLKALLKQNGGLSLSEILQQKNLTLSELLTGNQEAIKALADSSEVATPPSTQSSSENTVTSTTQRSSSITEKYDGYKYKRLPPSIALKKENINRKYDHETLTEEEMLEAQRKRQALLLGLNYKSPPDGIFAEVTRYEVITEPTTEKRVFVPSHPKLYTSINYRPELSKIADIGTEAYSKYETTSPKSTSEPSTTPISISTTQKQEITTEYIASTKGAKTSFTKSKFSLPITSAKLNKMASKGAPPTKTPTIEEENYPVPFNPMKMKIEDILELQNSHNQPDEKVSDEPYRMTIDLDAIPFQPNLKVSTEHSSITRPTTSTSTETSSTSASTTTQELPKLQPFSAKDEILEILKDPKGRARLAKILEERNMTLQELIDQRERGSSQLHLADIFHNKTKEPEPIEEPFEGQISSEVFTSFPVFARQPKKLFKQEPISEKPAEIKQLAVTSFPSFKIEVPKDHTKNIQPFPWKQLYPDLFNMQDKNLEDKQLIRQEIIHEVVSNRIDPNQQVISSEILTHEDIQRLEQLEQRLLSSVSSEQLNIADEDKLKVIKIPSGVQSAIVASLVIVGLSLLVFLTILVVFRWTQKRRTTLKKFDSLKPPLFDVKPQNIKTFVTETLGKSKFNFYKNNMHSMRDVWERDSDKKVPF